jgi:exosortase A-associated hydrolase 2
MNETPFWLQRDGIRLFAIAHEPVAMPSGEVFVFCHPCAEEKLWTHRVFVSFARKLAAAGHAVLRFDLMGNGDSDGDFSQSSVESAIADVRCAVDEAKRRWRPVKAHLLGLRFGATIAALAAERAADIDGLILWAPIVDGERYMQELLRTNLATQTAVYKEVRYDRVELVDQMRAGATVNVDGYAMAYALYAEAAAIKLASKAKRHAGPCLITHVDRQPGRLPDELQQLAATYSNATLTVAKEEPFWKEIAKSYLREAPELFAVTAAWLGRARTEAEAASTR